MKSKAMVLILALLFPSCAMAANEPPAKGGAGLGQERVKVDPATEAIIRGALKWLASKQTGNGSWVSGDGERHEVAMTGYVVIAFMAAGHLPDEGEYGNQVARGVSFLLAAVKPNGFIQYNNTNMYGHGIASIALAEAYGQTKDARIKPNLERAIKLIVDCQNKEGGWRYSPTNSSDSDISVTVLQVVALRAAKNSGLDVPQQTIDRAVQYVRRCYNEPSGGFCYQPGQQPGFARTAAAIYSLQVCGQYEDPRVARGSQYLFKNAERDRQWFTYGHFYAAPAQYMIGGDTWERWYAQTRETLLKIVRREGEIAYWEPRFDGGRGIGPLYCTAVYTTILCMPYHYLPLYQR